MQKLYTENYGVLPQGFAADWTCLTGSFQSVFMGPYHIFLGIVREWEWAGKHWVKRQNWAQVHFHQGPLV